MTELMRTKEYLLSTVSAVINGGSLSAVPEDINEALLYELITKNSLHSIAYFGLKDSNFEFIEKLEKSYKAAFIRELNQQAEAEKIRADFSNANIDFMLLKGSHLKALYPSAEMRFMVDTDVLVRKSDVARASDILISHGFEKKMNNGKDIVFIKKPFLTVELHNTLFVEEYYMYDYFLDVWNKAQKVSEHEYKMSDNDLYIYTMAHLAEHFTTGGACFRPAMDIYLMRKSTSISLDYDYIRDEFSKLEIDDFANKIEKLGAYMFDGDRTDGSLEITENFIVLGPPVKNTGLASVDGKKKSKSAMLLSSLFPKLSHMKLLFPVLERLPFLLPIFWLVRIAKHIFKKETKQKLDVIKNTDSKDIEIMEKIYRESGIKRR